MSDLAEYEWLLSADGAQWLSRAQAMDPKVLALGGLRKDLGAERARVVAEQASLRRRGREKFPDAERMFFTRIGLEQATDHWIAAYKAARFAGSLRIADLCCGIGGDLMALAQVATDTQACDLDPLSALFAQANASGARVEVRDATKFPCDRETRWHIDPDRRPTGRRTTQLSAFSPDVTALETMLAQGPNAGVKVAPASSLPESWAARAEREWISRAGECRQQIAWFGELARHPGRRVATIVGEKLIRQIVEPSGELVEPTPAASLGRFVFEPDAAVLAAGLWGLLAREHGLAPLASGIAYLTGDQALADAALDAFEVHDVLPFDRKRLAELLAERGIGRLEIKKRGCDVDPEQLRKQLRLSGDQGAVLMLAPIAGKVTALICQRVG